MKSVHTLLFLFMGTAMFLVTGCGPKYTIEEQHGISIIHHKRVQILGYAFKDLNKNGTLDVYEDWRLPVDERISDLVGQMSVEQKAGLMLYSAHQSIPSGSRGFFGASTYENKRVERYR